MWTLVIIMWGIVFAIFWALTKDKREEKREERRLELEQKKNEMLSDPQVVIMAETVCECISDLKDAPVRVLRTGGRFYILFEKGSVYYETRWKEKTGDSFQDRKNTQCILDRVKMGKNPLTEQENEIFASIVRDKLCEISWLSVGRMGSSFDYGVNTLEFKVEKNDNAVIPEAF